MQGSDMFGDVLSKVRMICPGVGRGAAVRPILVVLAVVLVLADCAKSASPPEDNGADGGWDAVAADGEAPVADGEAATADAMVPDGGSSDSGCIPRCAGRECGDDGCGGSCGDCPQGEVCQQDGHCVPCAGSCPVEGLRKCDGTSAYKVCGPPDANGCRTWGPSQTCGAGSACLEGTCVPDDAMVFDVSSDQPTGKTVWPVWNRFNVWDVTMAPAAKPYPFYDEAILMTATGGRPSCEMYSEDANGQPVYDFSPLDSALDKVTNASIRPIVVIGNTPVVLSDRPQDQGAFDANTGAPTDYAKYRKYMTALASHLLGRYGTRAIQGWDFRLMTEPDNQDWWHAGLSEYQKLYDDTLAGLRLGGLDVPLDVGNYMVPTGQNAWTGTMAQYLATQPQPQVLFSDDFADGDLNGWRTLSGSASAASGALEAQDALVVTTGSWTDYEVTATMTTLQVGSDPWLVGWFVFRCQSWDNCYAVGLHADGYLELGRRVSGTWEGLLDVASTNLSPMQPHRFKAQVDGDVVRVFVDGQMYIEYGAPGGPASGGVGLWAWQSRARLDDVRVQTLTAHHPEALPRHCRRVSFSCYARGQMGMDPRELASIVQQVRQAVAPYLGTSVLVSVDEGQILFDENGKYMWLGDGTELGAAWNAAIFKVALDVNLERYVQWGFMVDGVKGPSYNVIEMYEMLRDQNMVSTQWTGTPTRSDSYVDGLAVSLPSGGVGVLVFVYNENRNATGDQVVAVRLSGLAALQSYTLTHYRVDRDHSNFFTQWLQDSQAAGVVLHDTGGNSGSPYDLDITHLLSWDDGGQQFWHQHKPTYERIDDLETLGPDETVVTNQDGRLTLTVTLPQNAVSLLVLQP